MLTQVYAHLLLVLDDEDFYERQTPFTLPQQRAIAAVLNTLLYHSLVSRTEGNHRSDVKLLVFPIFKEWLRVLWGYNPKP